MMLPEKLAEAGTRVMGKYVSLDVKMRVFDIYVYYFSFILVIWCLFDEGNTTLRLGHLIELILAILYYFFYFNYAFSSLESIMPKLVWVHILIELADAGLCLSLLLLLDVHILWLLAVHYSCKSGA